MLHILHITCYLTGVDCGFLWCFLHTTNIYKFYDVLPKQVVNVLLVQVAAE